MFWIPKGWAPYYAEWLLSFPRAPLGSVSIQAWFLACAAIILLVSDFIVAVVGLISRPSIASTQKAREKPTRASGEKAGLNEKSGSGEGKKEL
jgi:hypothetical protein